MDDIRREPLEISAGDTICWARYFQQWQPAQGWALLYEVRGGHEPTAPAIQINSTPDPTNTFHQVEIAAAVSAGWAPGEVVLAGYAVNAGKGERHNIYLNALVIVPNLGTATNDVDLRTFAQKMVESLQCALLELNKSSLLETDVQRVKILRQKRQEMRLELNFWEDRRRNEIAQENAANGRPSGNKVTPVFRIIDYGAPGLGASWPFVPNS